MVPGGFCSSPAPRVFIEPELAGTILTSGSSPLDAHLWMAVPGHSRDRDRDATVPSATFPSPPCAGTVLNASSLRVFHIYFLYFFASQHKGRMLGRSSPFGRAFPMKWERTRSSTEGIFPYCSFRRLSLHLVCEPRAEPGVGTEQGETRKPLCTGVLGLSLPK